MPIRFFPNWDRCASPSRAPERGSATRSPPMTAHRIGILRTTASFVLAARHRARLGASPLAAVCLSLLVQLAGAQTNLVVLRSGGQPTPLLELFTSEGCSSCPPAETWLSRLEASPGLWKDVVPVAFHVDYWNQLGWRDPWSERSFSFRQRDYAQLWRTDGVYTPGFVFNGFEWRGWSAAARLPRQPGGAPGVLIATSADRSHWRVSFRPSTPPAWEYQAYAALLANGLVSDVKAGENRGRRLRHDFVALELVSQTLTNQNGTYLGEFTIAPPPWAATNRLALAAWITLPGQLRPWQAVGGWLGPAEVGVR